MLWCVRPESDATVPDDIEQTLHEGLDWTRFTRFALAHRVTPQVAAALGRLPVGAVPVELKEAFSAHARAIALHAGQQVAALTEVIALLESRGVRAVSFKGPALSAAAYGDSALRCCRDLDLLTRAEDIPACIEALATLGFVAEEGQLTPREERAFMRSDSSFACVRSTDGLVVEPHWTISPRNLAVDFDTAALCSRAVEIEIELGGGRLPCLTPQDHLLVVCAHAAKHEWSELRWVRDLAGLVRHPRVDPQTCLEQAAAIGCRRLVEIGFWLVRDLLGVTVPCDLDAVQDSRDLARRYAARLFPDFRAAPNPFALSRDWLRTRERVRDKLRYVTRTLFTPRLKHVRMLQLPRGFGWLLPPIAAAHDYLALPVWRSLKSPRSSNTASASER